MNKKKLLDEAKELHISRGNCMKTRQELEKSIVERQKKYKNIIFGNGSRICKGCLNELWKQQVVDEKLDDQKLSENAIRKLVWDSLWKNTVMDGEIMVDKRKVEVLGPDPSELITLVIKRKSKLVL